METETEITTELTADEVKFLTAYVKGQKFWTYTPAEHAEFTQAVTEMGIDIDSIERQTYAAHGDVDRAYLEMTGPSAKNAQLRALVYRLHRASKPGMGLGTLKAHAIATLIGVPPKMIGPMRAAGEAAAKKAAETTVTPGEAAA